jgi:outer membrane protein, heavy metal efflux system
MIKWLLAGVAFAATAFAQSYSTFGDARLKDLVEQALENNPGIRRAFADYRAALQRIPQVSSLPDPMLGVTQYARSPETRVGPQNTMLSISQRFPWFGKLNDRGKIAAKEAAALEQMYEARKAETVRQVKLAYFDLAYIDGALQITDEDLGLLRHFETLAQARYSQGVGLQQAVVKLQAEITRDLNRLEVLRRQRTDAEAALNTLLDQPPETPIARVMLPAAPAVAIDWQKLYTRGRESRPEVKAAFYQIERNEKSMQLARREYWPDVTVSAGYVNVDGRQDPAGRMSPPPDNGKDVYSFSVGVNLPIFRRKYDAGVLEASERFQGAREGYRDVINSVEVSIRAVGFRIETIRAQTDLFENALLPQADQALRSSEAAYSSGTLGVLDLLDSERVLLEVRLGLAQLRSDYLKSLAEMERAIGSAFPEEQP